MKKWEMWKRKFKGKKMVTINGDNMHHEQVNNSEGTTAKKQQLN
jgi:hypothetical protein